MNVLVSGLINSSDFKYLPAGMEFTDIDKPSALTSAAVREAYAGRSYDLALAVCFAASSSNLIKTGFTDMPGLKGIWFLDSHVCLREELNTARFFDYIFVAHSEYIKTFREHYPSKKIFHLPCGVHRWAVDSMKRQPEKKWDLFMAYNNYNVNNRRRDRIVRDVEGRLRKELNLNTHCGRYEYSAYLDALGKSRVALNVGLYNDFNIRNLEALANGVPLLTDRTSDHRVVEGIDRYCVYFNPEDLSDISELYREAERKTDKMEECVEWVKRHHSFPCRILSMINCSISGNYTLRGL